MATFQLAADLLTAIFNGIKTKIRDTYYPVGTIYMSLTNKNPSNFIGGTWVEISGRFLVGHDSTTSMAHKTLGGEIGSWNTNDTTLTINQIPAHSHEFKETGRPLYWDSGLPGMGGLTSGDTVQYTWNAKTKDTGGGKGHNHQFCPPALVVKIYKRTA